MGVNDREKAKLEQEIAELRRKQAKAVEVDKTLDAALSKMRDEVRGYDDKYDEQLKRKKEALEKKTFNSSWDPKLTEALEIVRKPLQSYGENCEKAVVKLLKAIEKGLENGASDYKAARCVDAALSVLSDAENCTISFYQISKTLKYQPTYEGRSTKQSLEKIKKDLSSGAGTIESQIKTREEKIRRIEKADKYGVTLDTLDTHESYLTAVKNYEKATTGDQLRASAKELKALESYLNSKILFEECDEKVKAIEEVEKAEKAVADAKKNLSDAEKELKAAEIDKAGSESELKNSESELQKIEAGVDGEIASVAGEYTRNCSQNDELVAKQNAELDSLITQKTEAEFALNKTFFLEFGKKKELNARIASLSTSIDDKKKEIEETKKQKDAYLRTQNSKLKAIDDKVSAAREKTKDVSSKLGGATQRLEKAKNSLETAKSNLEKANQNYDSVILKKKEKEAALEAEIIARKEKAEEARKQAKIEAERKAAEEERKRTEIETQRRSEITTSYREIEVDDSSDAPLYRPGNEPEAIKRRLVTLFEKLDGAYPDKVVVGLHNDHKNWGETVTDLYRKLGYESGAAFLKAYGYTVAAKTGKGGRPASVAPEDIIAFLQDKYADGPVFEGLNELIADNPELAGNLKTINNKSNEFFGTSLKAYLIQQGILLDASIRREKEREEAIRQREIAKQSKLDAKQAEIDRVKEQEDLAQAITDELMANCGIEFMDAAFVITNPEEDYYRIVNAIKKRGGLCRIAVSGKTRFLIAPQKCNTVEYQRALEFQAKGSNIKILTQKQFFEAMEKYDAYVTSTDVLQRATAMSATNVAESSSVSLVIEGNKLVSYSGTDKRVIIPDGVKVIGRGAFAGASIENITIPDTVGAIEANAFSGCKMLSSIKWSANIQSIGDGAFEFCKRISSIILPKTNVISSIGKQAFAHCYSLDKVELAVTSIGESCFEKCLQLENVTILSKLSHVEAGTFRDCIALKDFVIEEMPTDIHDEAFSNCVAYGIVDATEEGNAEEESMPSTSNSDASDYATQLAREVSEPVTSIVFEGKIFVHTTCTNESKIDQLVAKKGGEVKSSTVLKTDYIIIGDKIDYETTKITRAKELNQNGKEIKAMTESEFWTLAAQS